MFQWLMLMLMPTLMRVPMRMFMLKLMLMLGHNIRLRLAHGCKFDGRERVK